MASHFTSLLADHDRAWNNICKYSADKQQAISWLKVEAEEGQVAGKQLPGTVSAGRGAKADWELQTAGRPEKS